jgi:ergothioneine biosynthesis protein EgtB
VRHPAVCEALAPTSGYDVVQQFHRVRARTLLLCAPLEIDDYAVQSMPDASPIKWHLAHTTWFFEQFILKSLVEDYRPLDECYERLFNSYYQTLGVVHNRAARHVLTRPTVADIMAYRRHVDEHMEQLLYAQPENASLASLVTLGMHHEQQHQELMLTDIKHAFFNNPLLTSYSGHKPKLDAVQPAIELQFVSFAGGLRIVGVDAKADHFSFDNEQPRHRVWIEPFALSNRLVTNGEYLAFVRTGGYRRPEHWLSDGWQAVNAEGWERPLYWHESLESEFTLHGLAALRLDAPVSHLSYYEADAFARWAGMRLPTEFEWEIAAANAPVKGNFFESGALHPTPAVRTSPEEVSLEQLFGDLWEWTASAYSPYPAYVPAGGAIGEYNGKFMCNQWVLRGGSCVTPQDHMRATYRNFFHPHSRWQFSGLRLAR